MKYCIPFKEGVGIYYILNTVNGKMYIGQTAQGFYKRFVSHRYWLERGKHRNFHLQRSYNKYGADKFEFRLMKECLPYKLDSEEIKYIDLYKTFKDDLKGYNLTAGGQGSRKIEHVTEYRVIKCGIVNDKQVYGICGAGDRFVVRSNNKYYLDKVCEVLKINERLGLELVSAQAPNYIKPCRDGVENGKQRWGVKFAGKVWIRSNDYNFISFVANELNKNINLLEDSEWKKKLRGEYKKIMGDYYE